LEQFNGKALKIGDSINIEDIKIELVPAYTIKKGTHPESAGGAGTIIETEGKRVYHAGDTERIPEMKDLKDITVALLPCGGTYTMDFEESTDCALDFNPEIVVPCHDWGADLNQYKDLMSKKDPNIKVEILKNKTLKI
jgi:L-ascorbate metabolism protein UlaG (beta-lactamase superfamily)